MYRAYSLGFHLLPRCIDLKKHEQALTMFFNVTLAFAFAVASAPSSSVNSSNIEPPVLTNIQPYGHNMLLLNNESTAVLDLL